MKESEITDLVVDGYKANVVEPMPYQGAAAVTPASFWPEGCLEGIWYHTKYGMMGPLDVPDISGAGIRCGRPSKLSLLRAMYALSFCRKRPALTGRGWFCQLPDHRMPLKYCEESFSNFLEAVVFGHDYDASIKLALMHGLSVKEAMSEATLAW